jgi:hypothetical protein
MIRHWLVLMIALVGLTSYASAEGSGAQGHRGSLQQQRACRPDVLRHCRNMQDQDDAAIVGCLKVHERELRPACRQVLKEGGE